MALFKIRKSPPSLSSVRESRPPAYLIGESGQVLTTDSGTPLIADLGVSSEIVLQEFRTVAPSFSSVVHSPSNLNKARVGVPTLFQMNQNPLNTPPGGTGGMSNSNFGGTVLREDSSIVLREDGSKVLRET